MKSKPLSAVDAAWFHMDGAVNTGVVTALATVRRRFDVNALRAVLRDRLAAIEPFHCRVVERGLTYDSPCWEAMPDFDIRQHVHHRALPAGAGQAALYALVADLASQPLSMAIPLWQAHVVDGPETRGALVFRYHHCLGDGAAMVDVIRRVFDADGTADEPMPRHAPRALLRHVATPLLDATLSGIDAVGALLTDLLKTPDPTSPFKADVVARQRVASSAPIPLARIRAIASAFDAKINDVAVTAITGALRHYLHERGELPKAGSLRAMMPVNLRLPEHSSDGGNEFGLTILDLPIDQEDAVERLRVAHARLSKVKTSGEALGMRWLLDVFGRGPKPVQHAAQRLFGSKVSLVLTNVAGPAQALSLAGRRIDRLVFWVPHPGDDLGLGISVFSYRGRLTLGVIGDAVQLPDPERIARLFEHEVASLYGRARVSARAGSDR